MYRHICIYIYICIPIYIYAYIYAYIYNPIYLCLYIYIYKIHPCISIHPLNHPSIHPTHPSIRPSTYQWFSNLIVHQNPLEGMLNYRFLHPIPRVSDSACLWHRLRICVSNISSGDDAMRLVWSLHFEKCCLHPVLYLYLSISISSPIHILVSIRLPSYSWTFLINC